MMKRSDAELFAAFRDGSLPFEEWTHEEHVRVAFLQLRAFGFAEGLVRMREGIKAYNAMHGVPSTPTRGYHETITVAFMSLVGEALQRDEWVSDSALFLRCHAHLLDQGILDRHYSNELLFSAEARASFVAPDREPLPVVTFSEV